MSDVSHQVSSSSPSSSSSSSSFLIGSAKIKTNLIRIMVVLFVALSIAFSVMVTSSTGFLKMSSSSSSASWFFGGGENSGDARQHQHQHQNSQSTHDPADPLGLGLLDTYREAASANNNVNNNNNRELHTPEYTAKKRELHLLQDHGSQLITRPPSAASSRNKQQQEEEEEEGDDNDETLSDKPNSGAGGGTSSGNQSGAGGGGGGNRTRSGKKRIFKKKHIVVGADLPPSGPYVPLPVYGYKERCRTTPPHMASIPSYTRKEKRVRPKIAILALGANMQNVRGQQQVPGSAIFTYRIMRNITEHVSFFNKLQYAHKHGYDFILEDERALDPSKGNPAWGKIRVLQKYLPLYEWVMWIDQDAFIMNWERRIEEVVYETVDKFLADQVEYQKTVAARRKAGEGAESVHEQELAGAANGAQEGRDFSDAAGGEKPSPAWRDQRPPKAYAIKHNMDAINAAPNKSIDLILSQDCTGLNTGILFMKNTPWSLELLKRVHVLTEKEIGDMRQSEQDGIDFLIGYTNKTWRKKFTPKKNRDEVAVDRRHVFILNHPQWNSFWWGMDFIFKGRVVGFRKNFLYHTDEKNNVIVHTSACGYFKRCVQWVLHFYYAAICRNNGVQAPLRLAGDTVGKDLPLDRHTTLNSTSGRMTRWQDLMRAPSLYLPPDMDVASATFPPNDVTNEPPPPPTPKPPKMKKIHVVKKI